jgi:hypothetical protein
LEKRAELAETNKEKMVKIMSQNNYETAVKAEVRASNDDKVSFALRAALPVLKTCYGSSSVPRYNRASADVLSRWRRLRRRLRRYVWVLSDSRLWRRGLRRVVYIMGPRMHIVASLWIAS